MKKNILLCIISLCLICTVSAQTARIVAQNTNTWFMYFGSHKISDKWGLHLEAQVRRSDFLSQSQQILLRGGINYHINPQTMLTAGYVFVQTEPYGKQPARSDFPENRLWEQLQLKNQVGSFEWISRFRLEQRYVQVPVLTGTTYAAGDAVYTNRFRILNRFSIPFKGKTIVDKSFYLSVFDEVMVNFGKKVALNIFDQNRLYAAIGYKLPKVGRLELGYLNQMIIKGDGKTIENNHTLQVGLSSSIDFYKKAEPVQK
jgi:hypothetical protein